MARRRSMISRTKRALSLLAAECEFFQRALPPLKQSASRE